MNRFHTVERHPHLDVWHTPPGTAVGLAGNALTFFEQEGNTWRQRATGSLLDVEQLAFARLCGFELALMTALPVDFVGLRTGDREFVGRFEEIGHNQLVVLDETSSLATGSFGFAIVSHGARLDLVEVSLLDNGYEWLEDGYENRTVRDALRVSDEVVVIVHESRSSRSALAWFDVHTGGFLRQLEVPFAPSPNGSFRTWRFAGVVRDTLKLVSCDLGTRASAPPATVIRVATLDASASAWALNEVDLGYPLRRWGRLPGGVFEIGAAICDGLVFIATNDEVFDEHRSTVFVGNESFLPHTMSVRDGDVSIVVDTSNPLMSAARYATSWPSDRASASWFNPDRDEP